jgi:hypothetical protein
MPVWLRLTALVSLMMVLVLAGTIAWQSRLNREHAIAQAGDVAHSIHEMTMAGLTGMMITGTIEQREVFLDQIKELAVLKDLAVLRADALVATFGPGKTRAPDALEKEAMASGKEILRVEHDAKSGSYLRVIKPTLASKNYLGKDCTTCHQVSVGTPLGAVSMKISLDKVESAANGFLRQQRAHRGAGFGAAAGPPRLCHPALSASHAGRRAGLRRRGHASPGRWRSCRGHRLARMGHEQPAVRDSQDRRKPEPHHRRSQAKRGHAGELPRNRSRPPRSRCRQRRPASRPPASKRPPPASNR